MIDLKARLEALDPLLFGENRSARAGEDHDLADQDPSPFTLFGAVGSRIAAAFGASGPSDWPKVQSVLGRFRKELEPGDPDGFQLLGYAVAGADGAPWFPAPLHLRFDRRTSALGTGDVRLIPHDSLRPEPWPRGTWSSTGPGWRLRAPGEEPEEEAEGQIWIDQSLLGAALTGASSPSALAGQAELPTHLFRPENRIGLAIRNRTNTAVEGRLFARPYRRFASFVPQTGPAWRSGGYVVYVRVRELAGKTASDLGGIGFLGGDRGRCKASFVEEDPLAALRGAVEGVAGEADGLLLYLLTPAPASTSWPEVEGQVPLAAAVGKGRRISGWNGASHRPRGIEVLIPEGSVAFYRWPEGRGTPEARVELIRSLWLQSIADRFSNVGLGRVLPGIWRAGDGD
ncbi:MAG: type III-B CRISPR module-associated Cmr3 family protein [Acidobacteriota bacterium]